MKATDHLSMPELISREYEVRLSEEELQRYNDLKSRLVLQIPDGEITAANAASLSGKLCQMANINTEPAIIKVYKWLCYVELVQHSSAAGCNCIYPFTI